MSDQIIEDVLNNWAARQQIALGDVPPQVRFEVKERLLDAYLTLRPVIQAHGGVMPEDLPEVDRHGPGGTVYSCGDNIRRADETERTKVTAEARKQGLALLAIARRIEGNA